MHVWVIVWRYCSTDPDEKRGVWYSIAFALREGGARTGQSSHSRRLYSVWFMCRRNTLSQFSILLFFLFVVAGIVFILFCFCSRKCVRVWGWNVFSLLEWIVFYCSLLFLFVALRVSVCVCVQQHIICHWVENTRSDKKVKQENDTQFKALAESGKGCYLKFTVPNWISFDVVHNTLRKLALSLVVSSWSAVKLRTVCKQSNDLQEIYFYR